MADRWVSFLLWQVARGKPAEKRPLVVENANPQEGKGGGGSGGGAAALALLAGSGARHGPEHEKLYNMLKDELVGMRPEVRQ